MSDATSDFRLVKPLVVTDAKLTSSSVPEVTVAAWASGTTYALGATAGVAGANNSQAVYQSVQAGNVGHAVTDTAWWKPIGTVYGTYASGTTYALNDIVTVVAADSHKLYQSLVAGNVGNAVTDASKWLALGNTNRWKMFDKAVNSQTSAPESLTVTITPGQLVNTLGLLNVSGASVTVTQSDSGYSETKSMVQHDVVDWYGFFYTDPIRAGDVAFDNIPPYKDAALTIQIDNPGDTAAIGCALLGKAAVIGSTLWELTGGILSYSTTTTDTFGNTTMVKRANAKRLNFDVLVPRGYESAVYRLLTEYTDEELLVIGSSSYAMTISYGFLGQWEVPVSITGKPARIEWKGLI